jgi:dCTP deaminase
MSGAVGHSGGEVRQGFWSGETLLRELPALITPFNPDNIDCAAYTLRIGHEVYVSPTDETPDPKSKTKQQLADGQCFPIPPGQFAFLLTEEIVNVPHDALGFISMKATIKFRGLVNISGFHVDPGFSGQLIFSVFNAGPATVHLQQGQACFLIWYVGLDCTSTKVRNLPVRKGIDPTLINAIPNDLQSLEGLSRKIKSVETSLGERVHQVERSQASISAFTTVAVAIITSLAVAFLTGLLRPTAAPIQVIVPSAAVPTTQPTPSIAPSAASPSQPKSAAAIPTK